MEILPKELCEIVLLFLSLKDRIIAREVSSTFLSCINSRNLVAYRLENKLAISHSIEKKYFSDIVLTINKNFLLYTNNEIPRVHRYFRVSNKDNDSCIDSRCREKRIGNIYLSKNFKRSQLQQKDGSNFYTKRKIPYCIYCFNRWGVYASSNYGVN